VALYLRLDRGKEVPVGSSLHTGPPAVSFSCHVESSAGSQSNKLDKRCRILGSCSPVPKKASEISSQYATIFTGTSAELTNKPRHTTMGEDASIPFKLPVMASNGTAQPRQSRGRLPAHLDHTASSFGNSTVTDLCVGWAFGLFHALEHEQPQWCHTTTIDLPCHVEHSERI